MMNNKGFTMIEILAAVTILGIISAMAIMGYSRYTEKTRQKAYDVMASSVMTAAEEFVMNNPSYVNKTKGVTYNKEKEKLEDLGKEEKDDSEKDKTLPSKDEKVEKQEEAKEEVEAGPKESYAAKRVAEAVMTVSKARVPADEEDEDARIPAAEEAGDYVKEATEKELISRPIIIDDDTLKRNKTLIYEIDYNFKTVDIDFKDLMEQEYLSNAKDPASKGNNCSGTVTVGVVKSTLVGGLDRYIYDIDICCSSYQKKYLFTFSQTYDNNANVIKTEDITKKGNATTC